jgi:predicted amidophosphoribosyltransferase
MRFLLKLLDVLLPPRTTKTLVADATLEMLSALVSPTTRRLAAGTVTSLLPYRAPLVRALMHEAKYHSDKKAISLLGTVLADYLRQYEEDRQFDTEALVLVPVPLANGRLKERGYNQVEMIAHTALTELSSRYHLDTRLVTRTKETEPQARLPRKQRLTNMHGAFAPTGTVPVNATLILLDDVATTGSTLAAMEAAVSVHDFNNIHALSIAH